MDSFPWAGCCMRAARARLVGLVLWIFPYDQGLPGRSIQGAGGSRHRRQHRRQIARRYPAGSPGRDKLAAPAAGPRRRATQRLPLTTSNRTCRVHLLPAYRVGTLPGCRGFPLKEEFVPELVNVRLCFHDRCFDGAASSALFSRFYRERIHPNCEFHYTGMAHRSVLRPLRKAHSTASRMPLWTSSIPIRRASPGGLTIIRALS